MQKLILLPFESELPPVLEIITIIYFVPDSLYTQCRDTLLVYYQKNHIYILTSRLFCRGKQRLFCVVRSMYSRFTSFICTFLVHHDDRFGRDTGTYVVVAFCMHCYLCAINLFISSFAHSLQILTQHTFSIVVTVITDKTETAVFLSHTS